MMIKEVIVVEGRDDTVAVQRAVDADTIETHGFGISEDTWKLLEHAYQTRGLIILTDPDHAGEKIRERISEKFPDAKHAYLDRGKALKGNDIGVENAKEKDIVEAFHKTHSTICCKKETLSRQDLLRLGLDGEANSRKRREKAGSVLGIGSGSAKRFLKKINCFGITVEELEKALNEK